MRATSLFLVALTCVCACTAAPASGPPDTQPGPRTSATRHNSRLITRDELLATHAADAYAVVERLHPEWFAYRGPDVPNAAPDVVVYEGSTRRGYRDALRQMLTTNIFQIRYVDPITARVQYGGGHERGAIVVNTSGTR